MGSDIVVDRKRLRGPRWVGLARLDVGLVTWLAAATITTISDDTAIGPVHVPTHIKTKHTCICVNICLYIKYYVILIHSFMNIQFLSNKHIYYHKSILAHTLTCIYNYDHTYTHILIQILIHIQRQIHKQIHKYTYPYLPLQC